MRGFLPICVWNVDEKELHPGEQDLLESISRTLPKKRIGDEKPNLGQRRRKEKIQRCKLLFTVVCGAILDELCSEVPGFDLGRQITVVERLWPNAEAGALQDAS